MESVILSTYSPEELSGIIHNAIKEAVKDIKSQCPAPTSEKLLTRKETADKLKISLVTLNDFTKKGLLQSYLIGGRVLYKDSEVEASLYKTKTVKY
ncbi:helix-turn-helix domain-containing protein [Belliella kenyensis]|uniref:Helix-turn-helix domain-containing protein n=1 Tax=Belliella kenyensis TaxID=1472724 RepID=A0ABV8EP22_9BACT|nr:helix-turn-helix domain-containing protein [Belliella kenyensis]MCH7402893.1 helix-turn-helix domain-containing protein [Belliella kenyensis]MDN3602599.1 helix-turn-helix domain-containing protein [Belliella kenyensis]